MLGKRLTLHFSYDGDNYKRVIERPFNAESEVTRRQFACTTQSLDDLAICLLKSNNFPVTSFWFGDLRHFGNGEVNRFLAIWGERITKLRVSVDAVNFGLLGQILAITVPNVEELHIDCGSELHTTTVNLPEFRLPKLLVLRVNTAVVDQYRPIIETLVVAATNLHSFFHLKRNKMVKTSGIDIAEVAMLMRLHKLQCVKDLEVKLSAKTINYYIAAQLNHLRLETMTVSFRQSAHVMLPEAGQTLTKLFDLNKDVVRTLILEPLVAVGPYLEIPVKANLRKLCLKWLPSSEDFFPQLFEMADNFV